MANISNTKQILCHTCISTFKGMLRTSHCREYQDLLAGKDAGCFVCTWLWERLLLPLSYHDQNDKKEPIFYISCLVIRGWDSYHTHFSIQCDWAPPAELKRTSAAILRITHF
ncbi:uncharacterized protein GGS22DRAFT_14974 [Annulohypoxylon maeteangense]|uniref:uncharacterized protein n=1 Tax=Annulohypoxylon maeteangense TaxID=1927788 RepID=UPI002008012D|nr:uncharacterized protein GGS22DRAFT_14974 [Annulohypoxylon maeteangense]KAI0890549.1 hypothetical protein GGS22DRAFT_14974 [Annulohypoxylon maeteangense]